MRLLELTAEETAFLSAPAAAPERELPARLMRKLEATLHARLRLPVSMTTQPAPAFAGEPATPQWQADGALAALWLTRRLGGQHVMGATAFVSRTLIDTLDTALAESWLDAPAERPPAALAWHITAAATQATLAVRLPQQSIDMTRWARGVIRHA